VQIIHLPVPLPGGRLALTIPRRPTTLFHHDGDDVFSSSPSSRSLSRRWCHVASRLQGFPQETALKPAAVACFRGFRVLVVSNAHMAPVVGARHSRATRFLIFNWGNVGDPNDFLLFAYFLYPNKMLPIEYQGVTDIASNGRS
jgi:hypothetical protein